MKKEHRGCANVTTLFAVDRTISTSAISEWLFNLRCNANIILIPGVFTTLVRSLIRESHCCSN